LLLGLLGQGLGFAARAGLGAAGHDREDVGLRIAHDEVGPQARVRVEVRREAVVTRQDDASSARDGLEPVGAAEHVEVRSPERDVLVEGLRGNGVRIGVDGEGEQPPLVMLGHPLVEDNASLEARLAE